MAQVTAWPEPIDGAGDRLALDYGSGDQVAGRMGVQNTNPRNRSADAEPRAWAGPPLQNGDAAMRDDPASERPQGRG